MSLTSIALFVACAISLHAFSTAAAVQAKVEKGVVISMAILSPSSSTTARLRGLQGTFPKCFSFFAPRCSCITVCH
jgi:hypothetical protein